MIYVALLRGINVGGKRSVPMERLREVFSLHGLTDVRTHIQSGNVIFGSARKVSSPALEDALRQRFGMDIDVIVRTGADLRKVIAENPFPESDPKALHVGFMARPAPAASVKQLDLAPFAPETVVVRGPHVYFCLPDGMGRSRLPAYVDRKLKVPTTIRNWNTTVKLLELATS